MPGLRPAVVLADMARRAEAAQASSTSRVAGVLRAACVRAGTALPPRRCAGARARRGRRQAGCARPGARARARGKRACARGPCGGPRRGREGDRAGARRGAPLGRSPRGERPCAQWARSGARCGCAGAARVGAGAYHAWCGCGRAGGRSRVPCARPIPARRRSGSRGRGRRPCGVPERGSPAHSSGCERRACARAPQRRPGRAPCPRACCAT